MLFFKGFAVLNDFVVSVTAEPILQALIFFGILYVASDIISIPFAYYGIFKIEEKYGFNKMTMATFLSDKLKGYLLTAILGGGIMVAILWFYYTCRHILLAICLGISNVFLSIYGDVLHFYFCTDF
jgi:STE24 endopeptidase